LGGAAGSGHEGTAAGVPYLATPPHDAGGPAPLVLLWHGFDEPSSEEEMRQKLALDGLNAWRVYLGLPMSGRRLPEGGMEEIMRRGYEDALLNLHGPIITKAVEELPEVVTELNDRLGTRDRPPVLVGFSAGGAVVMLALAESDVPCAAAAAISAPLDVAKMVSANERMFGITYTWSEQSRELAKRLNAAQRASDIVKRHPEAAILLTAGDQDPVVGPEQLDQTSAALKEHGFSEDHIETCVFAGQGHEVGPQVNELLEDWLRRHFSVRV
jgi:predicted esterase